MSDLPLSPAPDSVAPADDQAALFALPEAPAPKPADGAKPYLVLARKYRSKDFSELIGQEALVRTLTNAFATGRIAHAFMLTGVRGVGKTSTARIIAKGLNCEQGPTITPCGKCSACVSISNGSAVDVLELDAASRTGVDNVRELIDNVQYAPASLRTKVYIIDEVHMLSTAAFNALLKTLEEPPPHVKFIFATTEIRKVPITVLSRCQRFDLRRIAPDLLQAHFRKIAEAEGISIDDEAIAIIARAADGSARDGLSLLDQAIARGGSPITAEIVRDMMGLADRSRLSDLLSFTLKGQVAEALEVVQDLHRVGADALLVLQDLMDGVHQLSRAKVLPEREFAAPLSAPEAKAYLTMAEGLNIAVLARAWQVLLKGVSEVQTAPQPIIALEMLIIRLCHIGTLPLPGDLLKKLEQVDLSTLSVAAVTGAAPLPQGTPVAMIGGQVGGQAGAMMRRAAGDGMSASAYAQPVMQAVAAVQPQNWRQLVAFVREQQEMHLAAQLYGAVECISFAPGRLNLFLREGVSPALAPRLSQQLTAWLGQPWMITLANAPTRPTLSEEDEAEHHDMLAKVAEHPLVRSVLLAFPGAKLSSVREPEVQEVDVAAGQGLPNSAIYDDEDGVFPTTDFLET